MVYSFIHNWNSFFNGSLYRQHLSLFSFFFSCLQTLFLPEIKCNVCKPWFSCINISLGPFPLSRQLYTVWSQAYTCLSANLKQSLTEQKWPADLYTAMNLQQNSNTFLHVNRNTEFIERKIFEIYGGWSKSKVDIDWCTSTQSLETEEWK